MSSTPHPKIPVVAASEPGQAASSDSAHGRVESSPPRQMDSTADVAMSRLTALRLDTYAQTLRALRPPTAVAPPAGDEVSALTAAQFSAHAQMLQKINILFVGAHEALMKRLANKAGSNVSADPGEATT